VRHGNFNTVILHHGLYFYTIIHSLTKFSPHADFYSRISPHIGHRYWFMTTVGRFQLLCVILLYLVIFRCNLNPLRNRKLKLNEMNHGSKVMLRCYYKLYVQHTMHFCIIPPTISLWSDEFQIVSFISFLHLSSSFKVFI
jgi:hypothetical protein